MLEKRRDEYNLEYSWAVIAIALSAEAHAFLIVQVMEEGELQIPEISENEVREATGAE